MPQTGARRDSRRTPCRPATAGAASLLASLAVCSAALASSPGHGRARFALDWSAPSDCPQRDDAQRQLGLSLSSAGPAEVVWARVVLARATQGWTAFLDVQVGAERREEYLHGESCEQAARGALALVARWSHRGVGPDAEVAAAKNRLEPAAAPPPPPTNAHEAPPPPSTPPIPATNSATDSSARPAAPAEASVTRHPVPLTSTTQSMADASPPSQRVAVAPIPRASGAKARRKAATTSSGPTQGDRFTIGVTVGRPDTFGLAISARAKALEFGIDLGFLSSTMAGIRGAAGYAIPLHEGRTAWSGLRVDAPILASLFKCVKSDGQADFTAVELSGGLELVEWFSRHIGISARIDLGVGYMISATYPWPTFFDYSDATLQDNQPFADEGSLYPIGRISLGLAF